MVRKGVFWVFVCVSFVVFCLGMDALAKDTIKVGIIGPMQFVQGKGHWNGATMAQEQLNSKGGIKVGDKMLKIELVKADSNEFISVPDATNAMELLLTRDKVDFVIGGFRTEAVLAMQDIVAERKKLFFGCGAAHPELCTRVAQNYDKYKYFFRVTPFNSTFLARTSFIQAGMVGAMLKQALGLEKVKVAVVAEKAMWADPMVEAASKVFGDMGMEVVGAWRPSPVAVDVTAELSAIQRAGAHMIFTVFSSSVGIPFARQAGELKIPAAVVGINVEAQKQEFWQATQGKGNFVMTLTTYVQGVEVNDLTAPFVETYAKKFGEAPTYTADTYTTLVHILKPAIEAVGSLDPEKLIPYIEKTEFPTPSGKIAYTVDDKGRQTHDVRWGPGYVTSLGAQWQDGKLVGVWPYKWKPTPESPEITYKGIVPYKIPPWVVEHYKK